jgi:signal peptidase I
MSKAEQKQSNIKETIDQILMAFIFALTFRCFIMEAYVIPTGSMAPTLMGAHMDFRCPDCGYPFQVNYSNERSDPTVERSTVDQNPNAPVPPQSKRVFPIRCPNCSYRFAPESASDPDNDASAPHISFGDRILVLKYDYLFRKPTRWDVVVFKTPDKPNGQLLETDQHQDNYIKRLVGRPGETLMVLDGDIYVADAAKPLDQLTPADFTVQTKPYAAQSALWRVVYDNDFRPRGLERTYANGRYVEPTWASPWLSTDDKWKTSAGRFECDTSEKPSTLVFDGDATMAAKFPLTDWLAYDVTANLPDTNEEFRWNFNAYRNGPLSNVTDVQVRLDYRRHSGNGPFDIRLTKYADAFIGRILPDRVEILRNDGNDSNTVLASAPLVGVGASKPARIEFQNVDYRVSLRIDGKEVLATTPEQYSPNIANLLASFHAREPAPKPVISLQAEQQSCELKHVSLWRDVFYMNVMPTNGSPVRWASPANFMRPADSRAPSTGQLVQLGPDEYFVCGDNSFMSGDARMWGSAVTRLATDNLAVTDGRVPGRFLLGRAFFVYWPAGYRAFSWLPPLVPNAGEMRFIH